jgi:hypothetical protein
LGEIRLALVCLFPGFLLDLVATDRAAFEAGRLDAFETAARALPGVRDFADFLRVFLDIRLPFVAFRGSIMEY